VEITDVRTACICGNYRWPLVRVYTDEGLVGLGECYWGAGIEAIARALKGLLVGEDPQNIEWLYQKMIRGMSGAGSTGGATVSAISGVELALWDLKGKILNTPIYNLLGGRFRSQVKVYADCGHGDEPTPRSWGQRAKQAVAKGFSIIKFDIDNTRSFVDPYHNSQRGWLEGNCKNVSNAELDLMVSLLGGVRDAVGYGVDVAVDCHWTYPVRDAIRMAKAFEQFRIVWLEDPTPPDNIEALKRVTDSSPVPICSGENHYTRHGLRQMITTQAVDILQPDFPKMGGLLEAKKAADMADTYYIPVAAHNVCSPVGTLAAAHACASIKNFTVIEFHAQDVDWWDDLILGGGPLIQNGYIALPERAGLGIELNDQAAKAHSAGDSTFFEQEPIHV
jgi:L-alanine-DL-glutamate epimerase-like enolase superfamily enzyme